MGEVWEAVRRRPVAFLWSRWPVRSVLYLASTPFVCLLWLMCCLPLTVLAGVPLGLVERRRLGWMSRAAVRSAHGGRPLLTEFATWSELFYGLLLVPLSLLDAALIGLFVVIPLGLVLYPPYVAAVHVLGLPWPDPGVPASTIAPVMLPALALLIVGGYVLSGCAAGHARLARLLLADNTELTELTRSRTRVVKAFDAELKRIERDLHDGAQQRLTAVIMTLGIARYRLGERESEIGGLIAKAQDDAGQALTELRELVHGIYPAVLGERGLAAALVDLAESNPVPVTAHVDLAPRLPEEVAAALYFAVRELLTNVNKHSGAASAELTVTVTNGLLRIEVRDDGVGGADGLLSVQDRMGAVGGTMTVTSPAGGPTTIVLEMACG